MARIDHLDLGGAHYSAEDEEVHGYGVYDMIDGRFKDPFAMSTLELPPLAMLEGFPDMKDLEAMWLELRPHNSPRRMALWYACVAGGQARVWQVQVLQGFLPQGSPARQALEDALGEHTLLHVAACAEPP